jgi:hypothetical protein
MNNRFEFLQSNRFWALVIGALSIYAQSKGWIGDSEMILIATITAGFTTIKTIDRSVELASVGKTPVPEAVPKKKKKV